MTKSASMFMRCFVVSLGGWFSMLSWVMAEEAVSTWAVQITKEGSKVVGCALATPKISLDDGQGQTTIWLELNPETLTIKTKSAIDTEFKDIGLKVDDKAFRAWDELSGHNDVVFKKDVDGIVKEFIHGQKVQLSLRFWPTWPTTGVKTAEFSLLGFTKAYQEAGCKPLSSDTAAKDAPLTDKKETAPVADKPKESSKATKEPSP